MVKQIIKKNTNVIRSLLQTKIIKEDSDEAEESGNCDYLARKSAFGKDSKTKSQTQQSLFLVF